MRRLIGVGSVLVCVLAIGGNDAAADPPPAQTFHGLTPARLVDTRSSGQTIDGQVRDTGPVAAAATLTFPVLGRGGVPAADVGAVALNVTAVNPTAASFLTVFPAGSTRPNASNLNLAPGRTLPNMVVVPVGDGGQVSVYNDRGSTHVAVDVLGWFPPAVAFQGLNPARLADTRSSGQTVDGQVRATGAVTARGTLVVPVGGRGGVPAYGVGSVALNVTAVNPTAASFVTVFPTGAGRPNASNLNLAAGRTLPNMVMVPLGAGGQVTLYNDRGATHLAVDVLGWVPAGLAFTGLTPARLADTRSNGQTIDEQVRATGAVAAGGTLDVPVLGRGGVPASGVGAVAVNITAINPTAPSFVTAYPAGVERPNASNLNLAPGRTLPNMAIVPLGQGGRITLYNDRGATHLAVDVLGWFPSTAPVAASTTRVSVGAEGVQAGNASSPGGMSADGRFVTFESSADNLVPGISNGVFDIFVRDRLLGTTTRVSVATDGTEANSDSYGAVISANGQLVAFTSSADNLVEGDTNGHDDVFLHDRRTGTTTRVSVAPGGAQATGASTTPSLSADGRLLAFQSTAPNLVPGDTNLAYDVFVRDRVTGETRRASQSTAGVGANAASTRPQISGNGRFVTFESTADNLVEGDTNLVTDVFVHDLVTRVTTRASVTDAEAQANGNSFEPNISFDGRLVAFSSAATNLAGVDSNASFDVFVRDRVALTTERVSVTSGGGQANGGSAFSSMSWDGRYVAFGSLATNLVGDDSNLEIDVFVHDRRTDTTSRVSVSTAGEQATGPSESPIISADGRFVAFKSEAVNLVEADTNLVRDVFLRDQGSS